MASAWLPGFHWASPSTPLDVSYVRCNLAKVSAATSADISAPGQDQEAVRRINAALTINPNLAPAHNNLGNVLSAVGRREDAIAAYKRSLELSPANAEVLFNLGNTLLALGDITGTIENYKAAIDRDGRAPWAQPC